MGKRNTENGNRSNFIVFSMVVFTARQIWLAYSRLHYTILPNSYTIHIFYKRVGASVRTHRRIYFPAQHINQICRN